MNSQDPQHIKRTLSKNYSDLGFLIHDYFKDEVMQRINDGYLKEAVEFAAKFTINALKHSVIHVSRSRGEEINLDGVKLIERAFSQHNPIIELMDVNQDEIHDKDLYQGHMNLYKGAVMAYRNLKAHSPYSNIDLRQAIMEIAIFSDLMYKIQYIFENLEP